MKREGTFGILVLFFLLIFASPSFAYVDPLDLPAQKLDAAKFSLLLDVAPAGDRLVVVGERGHILYSDDQGSSWTQADVPAMAHLTALHFPTPEKGWAVGESSVILYTEDGGVTWVRQHDERDSSNPVPLLDVYFFDEKEGLAIGAYGTFLHTDDGGQSWADWRERIDNIDEWHYNAITRTAKGIVYIAGEAGFVYRSEDRGHSWQAIKLSHEGSLLGVVATQQDERLVFFGISGNIFVTDDGGQSWRHVSVDTKSGLVAGTLLGDGSILIVGSDGVVLRGDAAARNFSVHVRGDRLPLTAVSESGQGDLIIVGLAGVNSMSVADLKSDDANNTEAGEDGK